ncbi:MAG: hypothetical protein J6Y53_02970 [Alphaproteobacteria bacterium]|nr:hypothetical protein [Alphaproteobacteria bacterium]
MDTKWPYFDVEYGGARFFTSIEAVEQALRDGYVVSDDADEETIGNGLGGPSKSFKKRHNNTIEQHLKALKDHPEEYMLLYNLQYTINHFTLERPTEEGSEKFQPARAMVFIDDKTNNIKVDVEMFEPVGADLVIDEGKANFDIKNFNVPKAKAILDLLQRHKLVSGLDNLKLNDADEECQNIVSQAVEELKKEKNRPSSGFMRGESEDYNGNSPVGDDAFEKFSSSNEGRASQGMPTPPQETEKRGLRGWWAKRREGKKLSSEELENIRKADKIFENWLNKNKVKGRSWQLGYDWNGGWTTYTAYPNESTKRRQHDIEANEKGELKYNYEFKIYTRVKNGRVEIAYSLPPGKILTNTQAALIAAAFKEAGVKYVSFNGLTDDNEAAMRTGCAFKGLIPVNHTINFEKFDKMVDSARTKLRNNSPQFCEYVHDLAMQIDKNLQKKGIDWRDEKNHNDPDCLCIIWAEKYYKLYPFSIFWNSYYGLENTFNNRVNEAITLSPKNNAAQIIGAINAVARISEIYSETNGKDFAYLLNDNCQLLTSDEKNILISSLRNAGISTKSLVRDNGARVLKPVYERMCATQEELAKKDIEAKYFEDLGDREKGNKIDNPKQHAIESCYKVARGKIDDINRTFDGSKLETIGLSLGKIGLTYDYSLADEQAIKMGLIKSYKNRNRRDNDSNDDDENRNNNFRRRNSLPYAHSGRGGME